MSEVGVFNILKYLVEGKNEIHLNVNLIKRGKSNLVRY